MRGDGRIYAVPNSQVFHCSFYLHGEEQRESTRETDPDKARKYLQRRLKQVHADELGGPTFVTVKASKLTVAELAEALKSDFELRGKLSMQNASHLRRVIADFGEYRAVELAAEKIDKYVEERLVAKDRPATINRSTQLLGQCYALAIKRGHLNKAPDIRKLSEKGNERQGFFSAEELAAVISRLPADLQDFTAWCAATGMRKSEAAGLTWRMVHADELRVPGNICKNRQARVLPLLGQLAEIIKRRQAARPVKVRPEEAGVTVRMAETIFHRDGEPIAEFRKSWATACKKAGVAGRLFHDLRRSAVRRMVRAGVNPQVAKKWSGHVSDSMFHRYSILTTDDMREAFETAEKFREPEEQKVLTMGGQR